jgi:hypothetical protein
LYEYISNIAIVCCISDHWECETACQRKGRLQNVRLCIKGGVYDGNVVIIAVTEIYEVSVSIDFVSEDQTIQPPAFKVLRAFSKRNISLLAVN